MKEAQPPDDVEVDLEEENADPLFVLGQLARIVAHDFKNLVMAVHGNAELACRAENIPPLTKTSLDRIIAASRDASNLADLVLKFSSDRKPHFQTLDIAELVRELQGVVEGLVTARVELQFNTPETPLLIEGDPTRLRQLLMNLCVNGVQAMEERSGVLGVSLERSGACVSITVNDCGRGIPSEKIHEIFNPVFTTREFGLGHGLGLAIANRIVKQHGGSIEVASEVGKGARFLVRLPVGNPIAPKDLQTSPVSRKPHKRLSILYVDDEQSIRTVALDMLQSIGHRVTLANNGQHALEIVSRSPDKVDLVLTDSKMPEMSGSELALRLLDVRRDLPVIMITAFQPNFNLQDLREANLEAVLRKPFMLSEIRETISNVAERCGLV